eukprot:CAMPEP_0194071742 /NCGR_PEP_ID=MMETSP0009_2-20130614/88872_1 /TAXON_ID=210454 /ORGANISM="Grammatophora oceanica, Strain CCMP 410" /LENGTH=59 /DNA_ID=CAMNT_0038725085 /DNA_START=1237 /DNA_END=1413 /DNA_ORIENTATION=-
MGDASQPKESEDKPPPAPPTATMKKKILIQYIMDSGRTTDMLRKSKRTKNKKGTDMAFV